MAIAFSGYNSKTLTFEEKNVSLYYPVKMSDSKTVVNCAAGNDFIGVASSLRGGAAGVQLDGYVELRYSGTAPAVGFAGLVADGSGGVKTSADAVKKYKVLAVDTINTTVGFIL